MTAWDIHVAEVQQVLRGAEDSAAEYDAHVTRVDGALGELLMALPRSPHVVKRVGEFAEEVVFAHLREILGDTAAALDGTSAALAAYQDGDLQMAQRAQYESARIAVPRAPGMSSAR